MPSLPDSWKSLISKYQSPSRWRSIWQINNTAVPFFILWFLMVLSLDWSYWITLVLAFPTGGFLIRLFIFQHDCGHGSFFKSKRANTWVGLGCSLITFFPYHYWRKSHALHHATAGNLDSRGIGDVYTMTDQEYLMAGKWKKLKYRVFRNPLVLFLVGPTLLILFFNRFHNPTKPELKNVRSSVYWTNLAVALLIGSMMWLIGWKAFLAVEIPIMLIAFTCGTWLFYIQHQYENTYWSHDGSWDFAQAALKGSSYYRLPRVFQWFTGNIGFHHIHHLSPRIPNYYLEKCHRENPQFSKGVTLTFRSGLKSLFLRLWDEQEQKLISFRYLKKRQLGMSKSQT
ncbi:MAG TPA: fatty acid desaturase [Candidatus Marinimicrobia bacterium]|nr:MAG: fatty acid desaturase [Candidatus Marinimicrobia bacterium CG1_02_48_14]PIZ63557.1 MAG: fatty acid desaturase [Candidatus Marinimicrobia bacterium CG_4_10_14_0_2_um_filter_48_9]HCW76768.1 fatty acid desaturase [Candidatus Neomarinimicrobiota bacterium]